MSYDENDYWPSVKRQMEKEEREADELHAATLAAQPVIASIREDCRNPDFDPNEPVELSMEQYDAILRAKSTIRAMAGATYNAFQAALSNHSFLGDVEIGNTFKESVISGGALLSEVFFALHKEQIEFVDVDVFNVSFPFRGTNTIRSYWDKYSQVEKHPHSYSQPVYHTYYDKVVPINFIIDPPGLPKNLKDRKDLVERDVSEAIIDRFDMQISSMYYDFRTNKLQIPTRTMRCLLDKTTGLTPAYTRNEELRKTLSFWRVAKYAQRFKIESALWSLANTAPVEYARLNEEKRKPKRGDKGSYSESIEVHPIEMLE